MQAVTLRCPSTECEGGVCEVYHSLCVGCYINEGEVYMRVQTSGMPKRCIGGRDSEFRLLDFSVKFQL